VGDVVSVYTEVINVGRSSITIAIEVWSSNHETLEPQKVTDGVFVFVAIDHQGRTRTVPTA
jgi:acyl-CoA thioesterase YciA